MNPIAVPNTPVTTCRAATATVLLTADGAPLTNHEVVVAQRNHAFLFGCTGSEFIGLANGEPPAAGSDDGPHAGPAAAPADLIDPWCDLFNFVTLPFYWGPFEPVPGRPDTARLHAAARWFRDRGCVVKGHPLAWHTVTAEWLTDLSTADVAMEQVARIRREVKDFAGLIDAWDVINEVVIMPIFDRDDNAITRLCRDLGRIPMVRMVFEAAREANPHATLLLNDFDMSAAFECLIEGVLEAGVTVDALGLQSHMHQGYWGEEKTLRILDRFARYGLPIHFTETTLVSGELMPREIVDLNDHRVSSWPTTPDGESRQADEVVRHYTTLLSHPSVQAVTYWGFTDNGWLNAPCGFVRADGTRKPAYDALRSLIRDEWWLSPTTMVTDERGALRFTGFLGDYEVSAAGRTATIRLDSPGDVALAAELG
jgi:endo-1,4-beta-xylanase